MKTEKAARIFRVTTKGNSASLNAKKPYTIGLFGHR
jgi:hypothetical protein